MKKIRLYCLAFVALLCAVSFSATAAISVGDTILTGGIMYKVTGANSIANPGFDDGFNNWTSGTGAALLDANFTLTAAGGVDNSPWIAGKVNGGSNSVGALRTLWPLVIGKKYVMRYFVKWLNTATAASTQSFLKISATNTAGAETQILMAGSYVGSGGAWTQNQLVFKAQYNFVQAHFRWLNNQFGFDSFSLNEADSIGLDFTPLNNAIAVANTWKVQNYPGLAALNTAINSAETAKTTITGAAGITAAIQALELAFRPYRLTQAVPVGGSLDFSFAIVNPGVDATANNVLPNGWNITVVNGNGYTGTGQHYSLNASNRYMDSWNGTQGALVYTAKQTVNGLPDGIYSVSAAARASGTGGFVYANERSKEITVNFDVGGELGKGWNKFTFDNLVVMDDTITLGARTDLDLWAGTWFSADDFTITYYGDFNNYMTYLSNTIRAIDLATIPNGVDSILYDALMFAHSANTDSLRLLAISALVAANDSAILSVAPYAELKALIDSASVVVNLDYAGLAALNTAIAAANNVYDGANTRINDVEAAIIALNTAIKKYFFTQPASESNPAEFTFALVNPSFDEGTLNGWTTSTGASDVGAKPNSNPTYTMAPCDGDFMFNIWGGTTLPFFVQQEVGGLPNGTYALIATVASDTTNIITLYMNGKEVNVMAVGKGLGVEGSIASVRVTNGTILFGARSQTWFKADNFRLISVPAVNYTGYIVNPTILASGNNVQPEGWTVSKGYGNTNTTTGQHYSGVTTNRYFDSWNGTAGTLNYLANQVVRNIPNGIYNMTAAARTSGLGSFIFANDKTTQIINNNDVGGTLGRGWSWITVENVVVIDSTISIGAKTVTGTWTGTWFSADDFSMEYIGKADSATYKPYLDSLIVKARAFDLSTSPAGVDAILIASIATAELTNSESSILAAYANLKKAYDAALQSVAPWAKLNALINTASALAASTDYPGLVVFNTAIDDAEVVYIANTTVTADVEAATTILEAAIFKYKTTKQAFPWAPIDFTFAIANPSFELGNLNGWTTSTGAGDVGAKLNSNATYTMAPCDGSYVFNIWGGSTLPFFVQQTITGIPNGVYTLSALCASDANNTITLFMNGVEKARLASSSGKGVAVRDSVASVYVTTGQLLIGTKSQTWYKADDFRLTYYGLLFVGTTNPNSSVKVYTQDNRIHVQGTSQYEVYGINGIHYDKDVSLQKGIYIVKTEGQNFKVAIK